ncbi:lysine transporter LysE [Thalassospira profundimaris]|uniref:Lysine transporter LysE n=1 Tax=Thalassospira profundimaris TaxID=502049 RepID=A0A367XJS4_9PROT|nr:LysE family translocator [Thalassospira profundimaris]RCK53904.1 lysine transporter LysE [Thalassospira profundimaris]
MADTVSVEMIAVAVITVLAVISPGPDFAMVTRIALSRGRKAGVLCAIGIGTGISVHVAYTMIGLGVIFANNVWVLNTIRILGACYLIWLGISAFWPDLAKVLKRRKNDRAKNIEIETTKNAKTPTAKGSSASFWSGFVCNALNPKAMLFIVSLFSQVISSDSSAVLQIGYGVFIALCHMVWFAIVALALTLPAIQARIEGVKSWIERGVGACLAGLGIKILTSN